MKTLYELMVKIESKKGSRALRTEVEIASDCSSTCQVTITKGIITGCL